jgi:hypothetical protein
MDNEGDRCVGRHEGPHAITIDVHPHILSSFKSDIGDVKSSNIWLYKKKRGQKSKKELFIKKK